MDKIWYRNPSKSEAIGRCGGDGKNEWWPRRSDKSRTLKKQKNTYITSIVQDFDDKSCTVTILIFEITNINQFTIYVERIKTCSILL